MKHILKSKKFRNVPNLCQGKAGTDLSLDEFKILTSTRWNEKHQQLTIERTKDDKIGHFCLGWKSISFQLALVFKT